jgi:microcystin-dependent protein
MTEPFLGEVRMMSFGFAPKGWATCDGQAMAINQNQALFSLLGTTYGGNGTTTFMLPNLRARVPMHFNSPHPMGQSAGEASHTLTPQEIPSHTHGALQASGNDGAAFTAAGAVLATANNVYAAPGNPVALNAGVISSAGNSQPHENRQPFLTINFCMALVGIFPSRN